MVGFRWRVICRMGSCCLLPADSRRMGGSKNTGSLVQKLWMLMNERRKC